MRNTLSIRSMAAASLLAAVLYGCGGGGGGGAVPMGGGGTVTGLKIASSMSVITAQQNQQVAGMPTNFGGVARVMAANYGDPGTDYVTDETHTYVWDESMEPLQTVNMILCLMDQTGASAMVNKGAYIALVDEDKCEQGNNQSSAGSTGQSSGGQSKALSKWTVVSTRASDAAPQSVKIWVPGRPDGNHPEDAQTILVEVTITEGVSANNPYGRFSMNFKGVVDAIHFGGPAGQIVTLMKGTLETVDNVEGKPQFRFVNLGGELANPAVTDFSFHEATNVILNDATGTGGVAKTLHGYSDGNGAEQATHVLAFNAANVLRGKDTDGNNIADAELCLSRSDYKTEVWRYNLYHKVDGTFNGASVTAGQRVALNSGFPFRYDSGSGILDGHVSYWGVWMENEQPIPDGATITRMEPGGGTVTNYTLNFAPGKLIRRTANKEALAKYQGDEFYGWGQHPTLGNPGPTYDSWRVTVDANNDFVITHGVKWTPNGPELTDVTDGIIVFNWEGENLWLWSDSLGGNVVYVYTTGDPAARQVTFYSEEFVYPTDGTLLPGSATSTTLYCYDRCLKGGLTQADVDGAGSSSDLYYPVAGSPYAYTASVGGGKLSLSDHLGKAVAATGLNMSALGHNWGINTGEMVTSTAGISNPWDVYNQPVSYRWETGSNHWNRLVTVRDGGGAYVVFDRPMAFTYTHSTANDANGSAAHDGKTFLLQYGGPGQLWGFPWEQNGKRWHAAVTLKDGVELNDGSHSFIVKGIEKEQTMREAPGACGSLSIASLFADPTLVLPTESDIGSVGITLARKPVVVGPPAVIEGVVQ